MEPNSYSLSNPTFNKLTADDFKHYVGQVLTFDDAYYLVVGVDNNFIYYGNGLFMPLEKFNKLYANII